MSSQALLAHKHVVIIGGGIAGLTTALALLQMDHVQLDICIHERRTKEKAHEGDGGIMIQENAIIALNALGPAGMALFEEIKRAGGEIGNGGLLTRTGCPLYYSQKADRRAAAGTTDVGVAIKRADLLTILHSAACKAASKAAASKLSFHYESTFTGLTIHEEEHTATVYFTDKKVTNVHLVIGADGGNSSVRAALNGESAPEPMQYSGVACWSGTVSSDVLKSLKGPLMAYEVAEFWGEHKAKFGYFRASPTEVCWYAFAPDKMRHVERDLEAKKTLRSLFCQRDYPFPEIVGTIIEKLPDSGSVRYDVSDREIQDGPWGKGVVTLCGDAAHPMYPSIGMGACVALEDVAELAGKVAETWKADESVPICLRRYEEVRIPRTSKFVKESRAFLANSMLLHPIQRAIRNFILWLIPDRILAQKSIWKYQEFKPPQLK